MGRCSTPFGITDYIGAAAPTQAPAGDPVVLNAFRHHGLYRRQHLQPIAIDPDAVLNAFRHHGLYRVQVYASWVRMVDECSTPFGITDYIGRDIIST